jgi:hypothetical protein
MDAAPAARDAPPMHANPAVQIELVFTDVARLALEQRDRSVEHALPHHFMRRAHLAVPGDLVHLQGACGIFVVAQRRWALKAGKTTLQLLLDVLVQDET